MAGSSPTPPGPTPGELPEGLSLLSYLDTNGTNYMLSPITYAAGSTYLIEEDIQFVTPARDVGTGWNAGGAVVVLKTSTTAYYGDGAAQLSPAILATERVIATVNIGSTSVVSALYNGVTSTHTRANGSLANYAGSTGYPIGCMTNTGGTPAFGLPMRVYYVKITVDSVLAFDAVPVITTDSFVNDQGVTVPSGTVGMYDYVTHKLYTNRGGNTDFTPGY